ncbi:3-phosphoshikimate 1-carboxyvinyltransferase 1 [uncultured Eubacterium sp.]|jgi:3-phosphoshikimate 1-carboxyvinyltransferase|nr:3-phosphoshikimate 1-carboxyvinyltransferase 1 [uncultured Eubacterium sp.]
MKKITRITGLKGTLTVPGDKSISHRAIMFGSLAEGTTTIHGFLKGADCLSTIDCFRKMGISIEEKEDTIYVHGKGLHGLHKPEETLDVGNSGTTTRLISGILAGQNFDTVLSGDASLNSRPMGRVMKPLSMMGADITSIHDTGCAPLSIKGRSLNAIHYDSPVASAQVKSCVLLAGLYANGKTSVTEPALSRDHTERMLRSFGANIVSDKNTCTITPPETLHGQHIEVPGDISSAAFFIVAALITPNSEITINNVGINDTRAGILKVCQDMGADITLLNAREEGGEPVADLLVKTSSLRGTIVEGNIIPALIDELPVIALMACFAKGQTIIKDAHELRVKESDRIAIMTENLGAMGADIIDTDDGFIINSRSDNTIPTLHGASINCSMDHRIAMTFAVAGLNADGETIITDSDCVDVSYPGFFTQLEQLFSQNQSQKDSENTL